VSLPRSGSTLFYLLLLQRFRLCYFSNLMARLPESPLVVARLTRLLGGTSPPRSLANHFGNTRGWSAPNQGWTIFNRWLPGHLDYIDPSALDPAAVDEMRRTIAGLQHGCQAPFASKWQRHAPRLRALAAVFPEALFVHLRRSAEMTAQSILAGRREFLGDERAWLSARPRNYERIRDLPPVEQVCEQVCGLERDIAADRALIGEDRFFTTSYEEFCASPEAVLTALAPGTRLGQPARSHRASTRYHGLSHGPPGRSAPATGTRSHVASKRSGTGRIRSEAPQLSIDPITYSSARPDRLRSCSLSARLRSRIDDGVISTSSSSSMNSIACSSV
jgi:hypothetical protein